MGVISVAGDITNSVIRANGNVGTIVGKALVNSDIFAGVTSSVVNARQLPATAADLFAAPTLNLVRVSRFSGSHIASSAIGTLSLGNITVETAGEGVAAKTFGVIVGMLDTGGSVVLTRAQTKTQAILTAYLTKKAINLQNFTVRPLV